MIRNVVFDVNGVLLGHHHFRYMRRRKIRPLDWPVFFRIMSSKAAADANIGIYASKKEVMEVYLKDHPQDRKRAERLFDDSWIDDFYEVEEMTSYIDRLKPYFHVYLLSNVDPQEMEMIRKKPFYEKMEGAFFSCLEGTAKPDEECFLSFLEKYGLKAEECLFIDDSVKNIEAARKLGLKTYLCERKKEAGIFLSSLIARIQKQGVV